MKKVIRYVILGCILIGLCGCGQNNGIQSRQSSNKVEDVIQSQIENGNSKQQNQTIEDTTANSQNTETVMA
ncbi:MAG: hypothetical protein ACK5ML_04875, partial [Lachnospiraceae bacterium]